MIKRVSRAIAKESGEFALKNLPTPSLSEASLLWHESALVLCARLVVCGRVKRLDPEKLDTEGSELAFRLAKELSVISGILKMCPDVSQEVAIVIRKQCVDRVIKIYNESLELLKAVPSPVE